MAWPRAWAGSRAGDLGERALRLVEVVGVHRVRAQVDGEDMAAVGAGEDLVGVRAVLVRARRRTGVRDQVGALAECAGGLDRVHGHTAGAVVGAEQPAPARMHRQMTRRRPAAAAAAQDLAVGQPDRGHGTVLALVHRVQRAPVRVDREIRRVRDVPDGAHARDPARPDVVRGDPDALAAAVRRGVRAEIQRARTRCGLGRRCPLPLPLGLCGRCRLLLAGRERHRGGGSRERAEEPAPAHATTAHVHTLRSSAVATATLAWITRPVQPRRPFSRPRHLERRTAASRFRPDRTLSWNRVSRGIRSRCSLETRSSSSSSRRERCSVSSSSRMRLTSVSTVYKRQGATRG